MFLVYIVLSQLHSLEGCKIQSAKDHISQTISPLSDHTLPLAENDKQCQALGMSTACWSTHGGQLHAQTLGSIFCQVSSLQKGLFSLNRLASLKAVWNSALTPMHWLTTEDNHHHCRFYCISILNFHPKLVVLLRLMLNRHETRWKRKEEVWISASEVLSHTGKSETSGEVWTPLIHFKMTKATKVAAGYIVDHHHYKSSCQS